MPELVGGKLISCYLSERGGMGPFQAFEACWGKEITSLWGALHILPNPEVSWTTEASFWRINNLFFQLNSVSHTLLSFLRTNDTDAVINKVLGDIL